MGIRVKNLHNYIIALKNVGTLSATTNKDCALVPFPAQISNIYAVLQTVGTGANPIADVNKNGTTIFGAATKVTVGTVSGVATYSALTSQPTNVSAGDVLSLDIDTSGTAAANLMVLITLTRTGMGEETNVADHDTIM